MKPLIAAVLLALILLQPVAHGGDVPQNVAELWAGFDPRAESLESEVLKEWELDGMVCRVVRYQVGVFKGAPSKVAAFFAFPKGAVKLAALLQMHGGGQSASLDSVVADAKRGYASISINWGGNKMRLPSGDWDGPQTDWGRLDATHPPQRNKANHFAGPLTPDEFTLDAVESPRNSNWFLVLMAARRALTFLEQQPEVDAARIGAYGHSMGGKLTTDLAGIDARVKAAVPSCGGSGDLPGDKRSAMELACISDNAYLPRITCPILWLSPTNDFHARMDSMAWNWRDLPDARTRFSVSPHLNHHHADEHAVTQRLWFDEHLKGGDFKMPQTPQLALDLKTVPLVSVTPDAAMPVQRVDIYYSSDPHELTRFWRDAKAVQAGNRWQATCPILSTEQPLFVFANVAYEIPATREVFAISSRVMSATPAQLQAASVQVTDKPDRMIDDGARGWHDWYRLNWGHPPLWFASTRKLKDPKWRGPDGATVRFEIRCETDNTLVLTFNTNAWGAFVSNRPAADFSVVKELKGSPEWQTVSAGLGELGLANWQTVTEFSISPSGTTMKDGQIVKVNGQAWRGPREIRNLRWEGGAHAAQSTATSSLAPEQQEKAFNDAIKKSLEQEKTNQPAK